MRSIAWFGCWLLALSACGSDAAPSDSDDGGDDLLPTGPVCVDSDMDGYGKNCEAGPDCDDADDTIFEDCATSCDAVREGCACAEDAAPVECKIPSSEVSSSNLLCKTGKRYCRDGVWTACLGVAGYSK